MGGGWFVIVGVAGCDIAIGVICSTPYGSLVPYDGSSVPVGVAARLIWKGETVTIGERDCDILTKGLFSCSADTSPYESDAMTYVDALRNDNRQSNDW